MNGNFPDVFKKKDLDLHNIIISLCVRVVHEIGTAKSNTDYPLSVSWCHLMASLVAATLPVKLVDGYWGGSKFYHSWVTTPNGHIIDVSPIKCRSAPIMYPKKASEQCSIHWNKVFKKATKRQQGHFDKIRASEKFALAFKDVMKKTVTIRTELKKAYKECCREKPAK